MFHSLSSPHSFCTCSICVRASARGLQPPSWNLTRASHAVAPSSFSSLGPLIYSLHIWVHFFLLLKIPPVSYIALLILGLITQDFFRVFFPLCLIKSLYSCLICFSWEMRQKSVSFPILWRLLSLTLNRFFPNSPSFHICHIKWTSLLSPAARV